MAVADRGLDHVDAFVRTPSIHVTVTAGPTSRLENWPRLHWRSGLEDWVGAPDAHLLPITEIRVCGLAARRREAKVPAEHVLGTVPDGSGGVRRAELSIPERLEVAIRFQHADRDVAITWQVDAAERDALRTAEDHFFASIRCRAPRPPK